MKKISKRMASCSKRWIPVVRYIIVITLWAVTVESYAQNPGKDLLLIKTQKQLREIIDSSPAITGISVIDITSGDSFGINEDVVFPTASAIKVTILMEVYKQASQKKFSLTDMRKIEANKMVGGSGILKDLTPPLSLSVRDLCVFMMNLSDNSATNALIELVGLKNINESLGSMGFKNTRVQRKMIDMAASGRGEENIASPAEAAKIMQLLFKGAFINKTISADIVSLMSRKDRADSRLAKSLPESVPVIFKPGLLNGVSTEWAIINLKERPYAVAIMENYKVDGMATSIMEKASKVLYQYFWRLGNATKYGVYLDPKLIK